MSNTKWEHFCKELRGTDREGIEGLISYLDEKTDFKTAPASAKYNSAHEGGLLEHSLFVLSLMRDMVAMRHDDRINDDSIVICALLHDISKVNYYEKTVYNKKVYTPAGTKVDSEGAYEWVPVTGYKVVDNENRFVYTNHEGTSEFIIRQFIPLKIEESAAILHHHFGMAFDSVADKGVIADVGRRYPLAVYLHLADTMSTFIDNK